MPESASGQEKRKRGHKLEEFLMLLLSADNLKARIRFRPTGEEIDGSFELDNRIYLFEAKWYAEPLPASAIYAFKGKVDGKLIGTIGIFISMSGYSEDAVDALTIGKNLNVLLVDKNDIEAAIDHGISRVLHTKLRAAAEEGVVFYPFTSTMSTIDDKGTTERPMAPIDERSTTEEKSEIVIICEGSSDVQILKGLGQQIMTMVSKHGILRVIAAQGKQGIPRVANAIYSIIPKTSFLIIVADGDGKPEETERLIRESVTVPFDLVIVDPEIEAWFFPGSLHPKHEMKRAAHTSGKALDRYLSELINDSDITEMSKLSPGYITFKESILRSVNNGSTRWRT
ncbi:MAG: restriction endonuclease [Chlorobiales bacterium]|nr:restriction endonuclease [Chlorobiales bacterium]